MNKSSKTAFHLVQWRRVPKGTNGAVSFVGTLASALGGFLVGLAYYVTLECMLYLQQDYEQTAAPSSSQLPLVLIGTASGLIGSLVDSILGGYFQYSGLDMKTLRIVENPGPSVEHISGYNMLSNNQVNLLSCLVISFIVPYWSFYMYKHIQL